MKDEQRKSKRIVKIIGLSIMGIIMMNRLNKFHIVPEANNKARNSLIVDDSNKVPGSNVMCEIPDAIGTSAITETAISNTGKKPLILSIMFSIMYY